MSPRSTARLWTAAANPEARIDEEQRRAGQIFNRTLGTGYLLSGHKALNIRPNNRGVYVGRVVSCEHGITIKLSDKLALGDGLEIW